MKQFLAILFLNLGCCLFSFAQDNAPAFPVISGTVKGIIQDSLKKEPLGYVTVILLEKGKNEPVKTTLSKDDGSFEVNNLPAKPYQLALAFVGYRNKKIDLPAFTPEKLMVDVGIMYLTTTTKQLKEVEIVTERPLVKQDIDKITYDVGADPESKNLTALDMLRKVPLITVDADDNIELKGNSNYKVLVNGKTSSLFVRNPKDVFKSMPASSIKNIEVITNPPSKYEAEGVGGIINIITNKKTMGGYNGSINIGAGQPQSYLGGAYITAKIKKFGATGNYFFNDYTSPAGRNNLFRRDAFNNQLNQVGESQYNGDYRYAGGELSYEIDTLNLLTANLGFNRGRNNNDLTQKVQNLNNTGALTQAYDRLNNGSGQWRGVDVGLDYQHTFKRNKEQIFTLSYKFNQNGDDSYSDFRVVPVLNYPESIISKTENNGKTNEQTFQADYVQPIKKQTLEVGVKSILRNSKSDYYYSDLDESSQAYIVDPTRTNNFEYQQDIYAAYTSLSLKKNKWGLRVGSRLEETRIDANFKSSGEFVKQDYFNLIPSVALSRQLKGTASLKTSYTQRIERPGLWYLNPYRNEIDPRNIFFGNPALQPAVNHAFDVSYSNFIKGSSINGSLFYNFTNESIQSFTTLNGDTAITTYGNIGKNHTVGLSLNGNVVITKKFNVNINGSASYVRLSSFLRGLPVNNEGVTANVFGYASYRLDKGWRLSANLGVNSPRITLQGTSASYSFHSFSVNKQLFKGEKGSVSFSVNSPFQKRRRWLSEINDIQFYQRQESYYVMRRFNLSFNYRFGKLQSGIARKKRGIQNDDVKSGGGQSSGTGN
ncbi:outer membrane beta-barrel family protein [Adhaeribacter radiodurans]|uniref:TonB-dependent receptor n=1 Tax=Adhaeribacter radiodurans TaxID=2745197 RepID=A0A7L7LDM4_9BACT|nr:outer membrane beta-barrel family protein [Adhaeribacter radiodurans]QMU30920.1 TonB-dependent receptor [Adhaeribacter radiodurans]